MNESAARWRNKKRGPGGRRSNAMSNEWLLSGGKEEEEEGRVIFWAEAPGRLTAAADEDA